MQNIEWSSIDWTQTSADIAALLGTGVHAVARARRTFAPHTCRTRADIDWSSVDWSRRTKDIAADLGVDACTVSTARGVYAADTKRKHHRAHAPALALTSEQVEQAHRALGDIYAPDAYDTLCRLLGFEPPETPHARGVICDERLLIAQKLHGYDPETRTVLLSTLRQLRGRDLGALGELLSDAPASIYDVDDAAAGTQ
jgi:Mn-dependent DtxR family transcriptional regulator